MNENEPGVRITQAMIYKKQLDMYEAQIQMLSKLEKLQDLPERVRELELAYARHEWIAKIAYSALAAGVVALLSGVFGLLNK